MIFLRELVMAVPEEIRNVSRSEHTVVCDSGHDGPDRYMVRQREPGTKINGKVIGHIYNGKFVPLENKRILPTDFPEIAVYGNAAVVNSVSADIFQDLTDIFELRQAVSIIATAQVRVISPGIVDSEIQAKYKDSFLQIYYPNAQLSKNLIGDLLQSIGKHPSLCREFYKKQLEKVLPESHIAIDGMLKTDNSKVNDLSAFSRKGRVKGSKDISLLYAFDIEMMEPVCVEVFPGNRVDASSYKDFITDNHLTKGVILDDKDFPPSTISQDLKNSPELHFLTPVKRNIKEVSAYHLRDYTGTFYDADGDEIYYKKERKSAHLYLYSFMSLRKHNSEMRGFGRHAVKNGLDPHEFQDKLQKAGTVIYESDLDLPPETVYLCYKERWVIELAFKRYKNLLDLDDTRVQDNYAIIGSEFINFISSLISCRILRKADQAGILKDITFGSMMDRLGQAWRRTDDAREPVEGDSSWFVTQELDYELMIKLHKQDFPGSRAEPRRFCRTICGVFGNSCPQLLVFHPHF
jgi:transposase